jgi:hypothetical protein
VQRFALPAPAPSVAHAGSSAGGRYPLGSRDASRNLEQLFGQRCGEPPGEGNGELRACFARAREIGLLDPEALRAARARVEWRPSLAMLDEVIDEFCA